jgi:hypothetical protein
MRPEEKDKLKRLASRLESVPSTYTIFFVPEGETPSPEAGRHNNRVLNLVYKDCIAIAKELRQALDEADLDL